MCVCEREIWFIECVSLSLSHTLYVCEREKGDSECARGER